MNPSTGPSVIITTRSESETRLLGRRIGELAGGGLVLGLFGDLGAGKTVFVQGLARGLGVNEQTPITSPTYTLINEYPGNVRFYHVDLYRISDAAELEEIGFSEIFSDECVVAVEWAERCAEDLPEDRIEIRIEVGAGDSRALTFTAGGQRSGDLLQALQQQAGER
ncbi:MAG: tRNA (adenosine(37)-N6)-threonylcarbamoyltransferase complex ATPase subunit type 1 TsaE [Desulfobacterales bacterium]|jgi:tRNA threonylcarbamoyladenosine biosynthesis protein TsaE